MKISDYLRPGFVQVCVTFLLPPGIKGLILTVLHSSSRVILIKGLTFTCNLLRKRGAAVIFSKNILAHLVKGTKQDIKAYVM